MNIALEVPDGRGGWVHHDEMPLIEWRTKCIKSAELTAALDEIEAGAESALLYAGTPSVHRLRVLVPAPLPRKPLSELLRWAAPETDHAYSAAVWAQAEANTAPARRWVPRRTPYVPCTRFSARVSA